VGQRTFRIVVAPPGAAEDAAGFGGGALLPNAYKSGRSWRVPPAALREARLDAALKPDDVARPLRAAALVCEQLQRELDELTTGKHSQRNWRRLARELQVLETALDDLPTRAEKVPAKFESES
jgi:hypothetical protein